METLVTINIQDDFLSREQYNELCNFSIEYNKVHWIGRKSAPKNPLYALVSKTYPNDENLTGATAWYNVRPIDPKWHNDIDSYCSYNRKSYYPNELPKHTFIYYMKSSDKGGSLEIETGDLIRPKINRLVRFPCWYAHRVQPYEGNRVSIGIIWWYDLPSIYGELSEYDTTALDRVWEKEDAKPYK
jgi:hypothetical protein|tara:strand:+ start:115 stop:672 length:558 start_codon:yes stop_codon:yes gene_type:complete